MDDTASNRDLRLPAWGPYSKRMSGISHIPSRRRGMRFDLSVFPAYYRGHVEVPDARWASSWHPREASADLRYYTLRHELEWKDRVYTDVSFCEVNEDIRLIRCEYVNNTDVPQSLCLHLFAALAFPEVKPGRDEVLDEIVVDLPRKHVFARAVEYDSFKFATPRPTDNLVYDSLRRGEVLGQGFVMGSGVGCGFGADGDMLTITLASDDDFDNALLLVRLRVDDDVDGGRGGAAPGVRLEGLVSARVSATSTERIWRGRSRGPPSSSGTARSPGRTAATSTSSSRRNGEPVGISSQGSRRRSSSGTAPITILVVSPSASTRG